MLLFLKARAHDLCKTQDAIDAEKDKEISIDDIQLRRAHVIRANLKLTAKVHLGVRASLSYRIWDAEYHVIFPRSSDFPAGVPHNGASIHGFVLGLERRVQRYWSAFA